MVAGNSRNQRPSFLGNINLTHYSNVAKQWPPVKRILSLPTRYLLLPVVLWCVIGFYKLTTDYLKNPAPRRMQILTPLDPLGSRVLCKGPRGKFLNESPDDELRSSNLNTRKRFFSFFACLISCCSLHLPHIKVHKAFTDH